MATTPNAQRALLGLSPIGSVALDARRFHLREVLTVQIDEGEIARKVRAELARHGLFGHYDQLGFIEGGGI